MKTEVIVSDTGPLIALGKIGLLAKLDALFVTVYVPTAVAHEALADPLKPAYAEIKKAFDAGFLQRKSFHDGKVFERLSLLLDPGEAEAISLAKELRLPLIIDERKGRKAADGQGIAYTGTGQILVELKKNGVITEVRPYLNSLTLSGYRLSQKLCRIILSRCGEN